MREARRAAAAAGALLALAAPPAAGADFRVVVDPSLRLDDLPRLAARGAVGLLVPGAGPETSEAAAEAALVRARVRNSVLGGLPAGRPLLTFEEGPAPRRGPAIVLGLPRGGTQSNDRRYPIAVIGDDYRGLLTSPSTRIPGLVSIVDVAPTALGSRRRLGWRHENDPAEALAALETRLQANADSRVAALLLGVGLVLLASLAARRAGIAATAALAAANLGLGLAGASTPWLVLLVLSLATAVGGPALARIARPEWAAGLVLLAVLAAYLIALAVDGPSVALSPLGPTQNARFYGLSNLLSTLLLVPALAGAALLGSRAGAAGFLTVAATALVAVGGNRLGADGGGTVVLALGLAVLAAALGGATRRSLALSAAAAAAVVLGLVGVDAATGGSSHVTDALAGGPKEVLSDLGRRLEISYARTARTWHEAAVVVVGVAALAALLAWLLRDPRRRDRAPLLALTASLAVSLVVNDSPNHVVLAGLAAVASVWRFPFEAALSRRPEGGRAPSGGPRRATPRPRARSGPTA